MVRCRSSIPVNRCRGRRGYTVAMERRAYTAAMERRGYTAAMERRGVVLAQGQERGAKLRKRTIQPHARWFARPTQLSTSWSWNSPHRRPMVCL